jgi:nitrite reductase/ring-hydroxylating ferredoxin subunit
MNDEELLTLAPLSACPPGRSLEVVAQGRVLAIFNCDGQLFALDGICPHQGGPLGKGTLCGAIVTCPWHGWQFDVRTGENLLSRTICQPRIPLVCDGTSIAVRRSDLAEL